VHTIGWWIDREIERVIESECGWVGIEILWMGADEGRAGRAFIDEVPFVLRLCLDR